MMRICAIFDVAAGGGTLSPRTPLAYLEKGEDAFVGRA